MTTHTWLRRFNSLTDVGPNVTPFALFKLSPPVVAVLTPGVTTVGKVLMVTRTFGQLLKNMYVIAMRWFDEIFQIYEIRQFSLLLIYLGVFGLSFVRFLRRSGAIQTKTSSVTFVNHIKMKVHMFFFFLIFAFSVEKLYKTWGTSLHGEMNKNDCFKNLM